MQNLKLDEPPPAGGRAGEPATGSRTWIFSIEADRKWQVTPAKVDCSACKLSVRRTGGIWTTTPGQGMYDADGDTTLSFAKAGYPLPGVAEGSLIGRIGDHGRPFHIGNGLSERHADETGSLQLIINDDLDGIYGAGYADNFGSVDVEITLSW